MSTVIRLTRFGKRHQPVYRAVIVDSRKARDGQFIEQVGFYNPNGSKPDIRFDFEKVMKWLQVGAQPSDTVRTLLRQQGIMDLFHAKKAGQDISGKAPVVKAPKVKAPKPSKKAKAKAEAAKKAAAEKVAE